MEFGNPTCGTKLFTFFRRECARFSGTSWKAKISVDPKPVTWDARAHGVGVSGDRPCINQKIRHGFARALFLYKKSTTTTTCPPPQYFSSKPLKNDAMRALQSRELKVGNAMGQAEFGSEEAKLSLCCTQSLECVLVCYWSDIEAKTTKCSEAKRKGANSGSLIGAVSSHPYRGLDDENKQTECLYYTHLNSPLQPYGPQI